jgi:hypothetical protein
LGTGKPLWRDFENESFEFAKKAIRRGSVMGRLAVFIFEKKEKGSSEHIWTLVRKRKLDIEDIHFI